MPITLNLPAVLAVHAGGARTIEARGRTLGEAVADVAARYPALGPRLVAPDGQPYPFVNFYVNDEDVRFRGGFAAPLTDGDEVSVIPAIAGGSRG
jgi:sulfur-carrier protein